MNAPSSRPAPDARGVALRAILEWDRSKRRFMESVLADSFDRFSLSTVDRAFCAQLCYGVVRHRNTLHYLSQFLSHKPLGEYHLAIRAALSMGIFQGVYLGTPDHALVDATIEAWNGLMYRDLPEPRLQEGRGFLNALLRRVCRDGERLPFDAVPADAVDCLWTPTGWFRFKKLELPSRSEHWPKHVGIKYSHPPEMMRVWLKRYDEPTLFRVLAANNTHPDLSLVLRREVQPSTAMRKFSAVDVEAHQSEGDPQVIRLRQSRQVERLPGYTTGDFWIQDYTARQLTLMMPERPGAVAAGPLRRARGEAHHATRSSRILIRVGV